VAGREGRRGAGDGADRLAVEAHLGTDDHGDLALHHEQAYGAGHVAAAAVDAGHELLARVATLGEAHAGVDEPLAGLGRDGVGGELGTHGRHPVGDPVALHRLGRDHVAADERAAAPVHDVVAGRTGADGRAAEWPTRS
jgi:hypothetical protein